LRKGSFGSNGRARNGYERIRTFAEIARLAYRLRRGVQSQIGTITKHRFGDKMKGETMKEKSQEEKLNYALKQLDDNLLLWGIDNWLGYRTSETMRLSVAGATNLVALVNTLNAEIERLNTIIEEKSVS